MQPFSQHRRRALLALPAVAVLATFSGAPLAAATPLAGAPASAPISTAPISTTQGIIMRDGGVCDPIRHMGC